MATLALHAGERTGSDPDNRSHGLAALSLQDTLEQPLAAKALGVQVLAVLRDHPAARTWRARTSSGENVVLVVLSDGASAAVRERFGIVAEGLLRAGDGMRGVQRVRAVSPMRDAFVADLWTAGTVTRLAALRWPLRRRLELVRRVARALDSLHAAGLVHGGLCAANVLLDDDLEPVLTEAGMASGPAPDVYDDLRSAGRLLQEIVAGDDVREVTEVVRRCLESRYATAAELERALGEAAERIADAEESSTQAPEESIVAPPASSRTPVVAPPAQPSSERRVGRDRAKVGPEDAPALVSKVARIVGICGASGAGLSIATAFVLGGSNNAVPGMLAVALPVAMAATTWFVPRFPRAPVVARLVLALSCAALIAVIDPLAYVHRGIAQRHLHSDDVATRQAAIQEIVELGGDFRGVSLAGVDLSGQALGGADLRGVDLAHADLSRARLFGAEVEGASFDGARLEGTDLDETALARALRLDSATCDDATHFPAGWSCHDGHVVR